METTKYYPKGMLAIRAPERYLEDGTYYNGPKGKREYFKQYWNEHYNKPWTCEICNRKISCLNNIARHEKTMYHLKRLELYKMNNPEQ